MFYYTRGCYLFHFHFPRLSFKGFRKGRFFHKQMSDEVQLSTGDLRSKQDKHSKAKLAKIVVESMKEGTVHYLSGENLDGTQKWEKCRLCLVKTVGGYMVSWNLIFHLFFYRKLSFY